MTSLQTWLYALSIALAGSVMAGLVGVGRLMQKVNGQEKRVDAVLDTLNRLEGKLDKLDERFSEKWDTHLGFHMEQR